MCCCNGGQGMFIDLDMRIIGKKTKTFYEDYFMQKIQSCISSCFWSSASRTEFVIYSTVTFDASGLFYFYFLISLAAGALKKSKKFKKNCHKLELDCSNIPLNQYQLLSSSSWLLSFFKWITPYIKLGFNWPRTVCLWGKTKSCLRSQRFSSKSNFENILFISQSLYLIYF